MHFSRHDHPLSSTHDHTTEQCFHSQLIYVSHKHTINIKYVDLFLSFSCTPHISLTVDISVLVRCKCKMSAKFPSHFLSGTMLHFHTVLLALHSFYKLPRSALKEISCHMQLTALAKLNPPTSCGGGVDPIPCVSTHRISDPRSGPAQLLPPHVKQRSHPHGVRPQIPDR